MTYDNWKLDSPDSYENSELSTEQKEQLATAQIEHMLADIQDLEDELGCYIHFSVCGCGQVDEIKLEGK